MRKILLKTALALLMIFLTLPVYAASNGASGSSAGQFLKVGAAGGQFLKLEVGARACAMGGAYTAVANDLTSLYWNPAGLADVKGMTGEFHYTQWFAGFSHDFAAVSLPVGDNFTAAAQLISFNSDRIPVTTIAQPEGTGSFYTVNDIAVGFSLAGYLTEQFSFGVTAKLVNNSFSSENATGVALDVGTSYQTGIKGIKLGFAVFNLGTQMKYTGQDLNKTLKITDAANAAPLDASLESVSYPIPLIFRAGVASDVIKEDDQKLTVAADFITTSDIPEQYAIGAEYTWNKLFSVRGGYRFNNNELGISGGVGFNYITDSMIGRIDYSISPTSDLGIINRISIGIGFK